MKIYKLCTPKNTMYLCVLSHFSCVRLFAAPRTVIHHASLSMGILQARIMEWVASRVSFPPRDQNKSLLWLLHCWWICYRWATEEKHYTSKNTINEVKRQATIRKKTSAMHIIDRYWYPREIVNNHRKNEQRIQTYSSQRENSCSKN